MVSSHAGHLLNEFLIRPSDGRIDANLDFTSVSEKDRTWALAAGAGELLIIRRVKIHIEAGTGGSVTLSKYGNTMGGIPPGIQAVHSAGEGEDLQVLANIAGGQNIVTNGDWAHLGDFIFQDGDNVLVTWVLTHEGHGGLNGNRKEALSLIMPQVDMSNLARHRFLVQGLRTSTRIS